MTQNQIIERELEVKKALKELNYKTRQLINSDPDKELIEKAHSIGYEPLNLVIEHDNGEKGILVKLFDEHSRYNNGIYNLRPKESGEILLEVLVPNNISKDELISETITSISNHIQTLDTVDLEVFDWAEIFMYVISNTVLKPLAKSLYPIDDSKRAIFTRIYLSRFLAQAAQIHAGAKDIREEAVNSDPYLFKLLIDSADPNQIHNLLDSSDMLKDAKAKFEAENKEISTKAPEAGESHDD